MGWVLNVWGGLKKIWNVGNYRMEWIFWFIGIGKYDGNL